MTINAHEPAHCICLLMEESFKIELLNQFRIFNDIKSYREKETRLYLKDIAEQLR